MITMMVYNLHCAHTPKENVKYFRLAPLNKYFDIDCKAAQNPGVSAKRYWPDDFEVESVYKNKKKADLAYANPFLILSSSGADALRDLLEPNGEFLPVYYKEDSDFVLFHPMTCLDALDKDKAVVKYYDNKKTEPYNVDWHYFLEDKIGDVSIFLLRESEKIYVTDRFVERVREKKLKGFGFRKLWSSELGCVHSKYICGPFPEGEDIDW